MKDQRADVIWQDGVPVAAGFDDPYYSLGHGLEETRHVFLAGNDLPARLVPGFQIAELGFGTGLNLLAAVMATQVPFRFTSFEAFPMGPEDRRQALAAFPELGDWPARLEAALTYNTPFELGSATVDIRTGDARAALPPWEGKADAWFLDGFSPDKNPELWGEALLAEVATHTAPGGTFATYTAAGHVRRALAAAGFTVTRTPGFRRKRHMSRGVLG